MDKATSPMHNGNGARPQRGAQAKFRDFACISRISSRLRSLKPASMAKCRRAPADKFQNSPAIWPLASRPIDSADGTLGRPGMVMMSPQMTTMNSAPADNLTSRIGTTWFDGAPFRLGSVEKEYWVFAMQIGNLP